MARNHEWIYGAVALVAGYLLLRPRAEAPEMGGELPAPRPPSRPRASAPSGPSAPDPVGADPYVTTSQPTYIVARPCAFSTTAGHWVYLSMASTVPLAWMPAGVTVTVAEKTVRDGVTWFRAATSYDDLTPVPARVDRAPVWFEPNADERARCAS